MYRKRSLEELLLDLFSEFPVVVLCGARQVGKTTMVRRVFPKADYVVFDPHLDIANARVDPDLFLETRKTPLILDEIQYVPQLVAAIKRRVDRSRKPGMYLLTGSQQWAVMKSLAESLAGRAIILDLHGFSRAELGGRPSDNWLEAWLDQQEFKAPSRGSGGLKSPGGSVFEQIWRGWLPLTSSFDERKIPFFWQGYLSTYIERDLRLSFELDDWSQFGRFIQLAAFTTGREINFSQFGRDLGVAPQTSRRWLQLLSKTFQWLEIPPFSGNTTKRLSGKPKGYFLDSGFACFLQGIGSSRLLEGHPSWGFLFETAVVAEIHKHSQTMAMKPNLFHWRTSGGAEVDVVLERNGVLFPIEVKAKSHPTLLDLRGIKSFRETYPRRKIGKGLVIAPAEASFQITAEDFVIPWSWL